MPENYSSYSLYLHIPFCEKKCAYCDFTSSTGHSESINPYIKALKLQFDSFYGVTKGKRLDTVYIGGGTPSILTPEQWIDLSGIWKNENGIREITVEVNPASISLEKMDAYKKSGVNRISMGVQTFHDPVLRQMGRITDSQTLEKALNLFHEEWIDPWSIDLIYGYPGAGIERSLEDIDEAYRRDIPHLSLYQLTLEKNTPLSSQMSSAEIDKLLDEQDCYWPELKNKLQNRGYHRYEISNFTKNQPCLHNLHYWNMDPWLGLGVSASGMVPVGDKKILHYQGSPDIKAYLRLAERGFSVDCFQNETAEGASYLMELMMMGFRSTQGVSINKLERAGFSSGPFLDFLQQRFGNNYVIEQQERLIPSDKAMDYHNALMMAVIDFLQQNDY